MLPTFVVPTQKTNAPSSVLLSSASVAHCGPELFAPSVEQRLDQPLTQEKPVNTALAPPFRSTQHQLFQSSPHEIPLTHFDLHEKRAVLQAALRDVLAAISSCVLPLFYASLSCKLAFRLHVF